MKLKTALAYLFILIMTLNCKQVYDVDISQPGDETNPYHVFFINRTLNEDLGVIVTDTSKREINLFYGDKNSKGSLINIQQIVTYLPEHKLLVNFDLDENLLPQTITSSKNDTVITFQFKNYDLRANTVDIDVFDAQNTLLQSRTKVWCGDGMVKLKEAKKQFDAGKGLRLAAETGIQNECSTDLAMISYYGDGLNCFVGSALTGWLLFAAPFTLGGTLFFAGLSAASAWADCSSFHETRMKLNRGECIELDSLSTADQLSVSSDCVQSLKDLLRRKFFTIDNAQCAYGMIDAIAKLIKEKFNSPKPPENSFPPTSEVYQGGKSFGDPNIVTFDGKSYSFNGVGEFIAAKSTTDNFEIQVRQEELKKRNSSGSVSWNTGLGINTGSDKLCFYPTQYYINQTLYNYSSTINHTLQNGGSITGSSKEFMVSMGNSDVVKVFNRGDSFDYSIIPEIKRQGKMIGVFGNFDKQPSNDLQIRNGAQIDGSYSSLYPNFTNSWRIAQNQSLFVYEAGKNTDTYTDKAFPRSALAISAAQRADAEQVCKNAGVVAPFLEGCINDVVATGDNSFANRSKELQDEKILRSFNIDFGNADRSLYSWPLETVFENNYCLLPSSIIGALKIKNWGLVRNGYESTLYMTSENNTDFHVLKLSIGGASYHFYNEEKNRTNILKLIGIVSLGLDESEIKSKNLFDSKPHKITLKLLSIINTNEYNLLIEIDNEVIFSKRSSYSDKVIGFDNLSISNGGFNRYGKIKLFNWSFKSY